ncbi:MAG TPA: glycosyltransferase family 4 protein [Byssovorax sp.]
MSTRALFFVDTPHRLAGSQRSLLAALARVNEHGVDPLLVVPADGIVVERARAAGVRVRVVDAPPSFHVYDRRLVDRGWASQAVVFASEVVPFGATLARVADDERADVLHFNTPRGIVTGGAAAGLSGRRAVLHLRGHAAIPRPYWLFAQALADRFLLVARALLPDLSPSAARRAEVVYNGVVAPPVVPRAEARARIAAAHEIALDDDVPIVLSLSSFTPFKGLHHLLEALARLAARGAAFHAIFAGGVVGDAYEGWLRRRVDELSLGERVRFVGFVSSTEALLAAADVLALPSVERETLAFEGRTIDVRGTEGLPRSVLEAMISGRCVVASRVAGVEEQIEDGVTGFVVPPGDVDALTAALSRALADPSLRAAIGERAREVAASRFSVDAAAGGLARALQREAAAPAGRFAPAIERGRAAAGLLGDALARR